MGEVYPCGLSTRSPVCLIVVRSNHFTSYVDGWTVWQGLSVEHRQRLLNTNDRLAQQNRTIENARKVMAETEQVGKRCRALPCCVLLMCVCCLLAFVIGRRCWGKGGLAD